MEPAHDTHVRKNEKVFQKSLTFFFVILLAGLSYWAGFEKGQSSGSALSFRDAIFSPYASDLSEREKKSGADFTLFWHSWDLVKEKYVDKEKLDPNKMLYGAINGMLSSTGDPYTTFFDPEENKSFQEEISGNFEGIGAELGIKGRVLTIIAPLDETPAQRAGLRAGDKILKINGQTTADMDIEKAVSLIRGAKGTEVTLNIFHDGDAETKDIKVKRDTIIVKSVKLEQKENGIAYIKVSRFGDDTEKGFDEALHQAVAQKSRGLIIDLRNNPGGFLETAVSMASEMLPGGKVVVQEQSGTGDIKQLKAHGGDIASQIPTIVLINEGSASASEILAGALKDNRDNVTLMGKKSFGKGSVQELIPLNKTTSVKITVAKWLTPSGKQINNEGIAPDVEVGLTNDDYENNRDPQMDKALEILKEKLR